MRRTECYPAVMVGTAVLLAIALVVLALALYWADALILVQGASHIPLVVPDLSFCLDDLIPLVPLPKDGGMPVPRLW
ncbi:hypothetical protein BH23ACT11_BH23ACT11_12690 [soil metagenome]